MYMEKKYIVTTEHVSGKEIVEVLGTVKGSAVRARHIGVDILAIFPLIFGGKISGYAKAIHDARSEAEAEMKAEAEDLHADAIVMTRYSTSQVISGAAEIMVYGTAVKFR